MGKDRADNAIAQNEKRPEANKTDDVSDYAQYLFCFDQGRLPLHKETGDWM